MSSFSLNEAGKVEFFGTTTATPDFLFKHRISYMVKGNSENIMIETGPDGSPQLFLLETRNQLRVMTLTEWRARYPQLPDSSISAPTMAQAVLADEDRNTAVGKLVYQSYYEDVDNRAALIGTAFDAAKDAGVTQQTARWFAHYLLDPAFFGYADNQEFTDQGVFRGAEFLGYSLETAKKQLKKLQQAQLVQFESLPKQAGVYFRFSRQALPAIRQSTLPQFFNALLF